VLDVRGRAPRQGDGDEGRALVLDGDDDPWALLLSAGAATVGPVDWWPETPPSLVGSLLGRLTDRPFVTQGRSEERPRSFSTAGLVLLRTPPEDGPEIWCRCDGGPHGFLSIAAHAHADALSLEVRHDGIDILADPGTYCYHGEPEWRQYFRSTAAHNTIRIDGRDQSASGGPFLWTSQPRTTALRDEVDEDGALIWAAAHDGYRSLPGGGVRHQRVVRLDPTTRTLTVTDELTGRGSHPLEMFFHLGPDVSALLNGAEAELTWSREEIARNATLALPRELTWSVHRGETATPLGWYSPSFGDRVPTTTLLGVGSFRGRRLELASELRFDDDGQSICAAREVHG
jgi:hypothetical protein